MKNPPILIAVIGFFAALAGFGLLFFGLRVLGFDWFGAFGDAARPRERRAVGLARGRHRDRLAPRGLRSVVAPGRSPASSRRSSPASGCSRRSSPSSSSRDGIAFGMGLMPLLILWYLSTDEVKEAFGIGAKPAGALAATPAGYAATAAAAAARTTSRRIRPRHPSQRRPSSRRPRPASPSRPPRHRSQPRPWPPARSRTSRPPAAAPVAAAAAAAGPGARPGRRPAAEHHAGIEDVEGHRPGRSREARGGRHHHDRRPAAGRREARRPRAHRGGLGDQQHAHPRMGQPRRPDADQGRGSEYSDLLEAAGVDSPAELAHRNATNLAITIQEVVAARPGIVRRVPTEAEIAGWIQAVGQLDKVVEH